MKRKILLTLTLVLIFYSACLFSGCPLIGHSIGSGINSSKRDWVPNCELPNLKSRTVFGKTEVEIILISGLKIEGGFVETSLIPQERYSEQYAKFKEKYRIEGIWLPGIGETITIRTKSSNQEEFEVYGFDCSTMLLKNKGVIKNFMPTQGTSEIRDGQGHIINLEPLNRLLSDNVFPHARAIEIILQKTKQKCLIDVDDILLVQIPAKRSAAKVFFIGLAIDVGAFFV